MKSPFHIAALSLALGSLTAAAQTTIFDQNFDGGYTGAYSTGTYQGGSPTNVSTTILTSGGNPNGCMQITMTTTTGSDYYAGQAQLSTVSGNTDPNPSDYVLSFDAYGSQAANIQFLIQTWPNNYYGGTGPVINQVVNDQLSAANSWQTFKVNIGSLTSASATGATWQLSFQIGSWQWGGAGVTDTLKIDNIILTHLNSSLSVVSSQDPSASGASVNFTATVVTNGVTQSNATGQVIFSYAGWQFSTNAVSSAVATSGAITNLPVGSDTITAVYSGGNYPAATNTVTQIVNAPTALGMASSNLWIYTDDNVNGFQNWSWATVNFQTLNPPPHSGEYCISVNDAGFQALAFGRNGDVSTALYTSLSFWINGGVGGQHLQIYGALDGNTQTAYNLSSLTTNWQQITIPLSALGVSNKANFNEIIIKGTTSTAQATYYVDDVQLMAAPAPSIVHLTANASQVLQTVDARQFGVNTATWDGSLNGSLPYLREDGCMCLRWPGGSTADAYNWASDPTGNATFMDIATNLGAQVFTTVNYGSGTAAEAAAWVASANQTYHCNFKYWEVGNECYGSWENDTHAIQHDPFTYATNAVAYIQAMKAAYPSVPIKVGVVVVPGERTFVNNSNHFAINPRTGSTNYGWTPVVLSQMKSLGVLPDFLIYHFYWQYTAAGWIYYSDSADSDPLLLQVAGNPCPSSWSDWNSAATNLRQQITDYIGAAGTSIELCVTENNSDAGQMGRQSTSVVNALYLADSTCQLMKTEFRSYIWWDLHNGYDTGGDMNPTLYGWRPNGDYGLLNASDVPYPTFYAAKLLQYFARPGDAVLSAGSDSLLLSAYAVRRTNGALTLLVINKDMTTNLTGQIALANYTPSSAATIESWGIPQDQAAENNGTAAAQDIATNSFASAGANFSYAFPPLSLTLFTFAPGASSLSVQSVQSTQVQLLLQGQPGAPYIIQASSDLKNWSTVSSVTLSGSSATVNIPVSAGAPAQFYRAVWQP